MGVKIKNIEHLRRLGLMNLSLEMSSFEHLVSRKIEVITNTLVTQLLNNHLFQNPSLALLNQRQKISSTCQILYINYCCIQSFKNGLAK